jgi:hypothetical protein
MGGSNEKTISGLRLHIDVNMVHIHDDSKNLKFEMHKSDFKTEIEDAIKDLEVSDGVVKLAGTTGADLCLVMDGSSLAMYLASTKDVKSELQSFIKGY